MSLVMLMSFLKALYFVTITAMLYLMMFIYPTSKTSFNLKVISPELNNLDLFISSHYFNNLFIFMVSMVTTLVMWYSSIYMEHYNNKKFMSLTLSFFFSMLFMLLTQSWIALMTGWDLLGLTSVMLVMFYPNKNSSYNSIMTMWFNRLGDMALIIFSMLCYIESENMTSPLKQMDTWMMSIMMLCAFTKSAQFPLSSWLPAAMSAPTPISAMVHSSTLVTAGIFILAPLAKTLTQSGVEQGLMTISMFTFLVGSFLANLENDTKKVVAFSTMSQISMILYFMSMGLVMASCTHMMQHAMFKTVLFCSVGILFMSNYSDQKFGTATSSTSPMSYKTFMPMSLVMMTGVVFSSSFMTKDPSIEVSMSMMSKLSVSIILITSVMTTMYCSRLSGKSVTSISLKPHSIVLKSQGYPMVMVVMLMILPMILLKLSPYELYSPLLSSLEVMLVSVMISMGILTSLPYMKSMALLPKSLLMSKKPTFSVLGEITGISQMLSSSEKFFLTQSKAVKPNYYSWVKLNYAWLAPMYSMLVLMTFLM